VAFPLDLPPRRFFLPFLSLPLLASSPSFVDIPVDKESFARQEAVQTTRVTTLPNF
jgi:hypothetical protein